MLTVRPAQERGSTRLDWLDSKHSFSFGDYRDPAHMGFRALRVINEDRVAPGAGFAKHGHRDMEILTYVLEGALEHKDSLGTGTVIRPGEVQRMSAGTGILHSEFDHSQTEPVHFLQIWIVPGTSGLAPGYEQRAFPLVERRGKLRLVASRDGADGSVVVHQDIALYVTSLDAGEQAALVLGPDRYSWVQIARGTVIVNGVTLNTGDGAAISNEAAVALTGKADGEALLFDLA
jgi:redox-sensitive bicupin YhaK (pirin superfamily)